ncbi:hypothetical protein [Haladaptatus caseinilyticus]|uniref:hypothetical protein n=1 Tax=Haladaptatus caseinilyticus TaxID=2993314 RepID=UPI00224A6486|nr:hypothetical protein [Haladaptatus caseinilyticus]
MLSLFVGLFAIGFGILSIIRPQLLFTLRHPVSVTPESSLNETGVFLYRVGGVFSILVGLWVLSTWGQPLRMGFL